MRDERHPGGRLTDGAARSPQPAMPGGTTKDEKEPRNPGAARRPGSPGPCELLPGHPHVALREGFRKGNPGSPCPFHVSRPCLAAPRRDERNPSAARRPGFAGPDELFSGHPHVALREGFRKGNPGSPCPFHVSRPCLAAPRRDEREPGRSA